MRKIYNKITLAWNSETKRYDKVVYEDSFMHGGEIAEAMPAGCDNSAAYNYDPLADPPNPDLCIYPYYIRATGQPLVLDAGGTIDVEDCPNGSDEAGGTCYDCNMFLEDNDGDGNWELITDFYDMQSLAGEADLIEWTYGWPCLQYTWYITCVPNDTYPDDLLPDDSSLGIQSETCPSITVTYPNGDTFYPGGSGNWTTWSAGGTVTLTDSHMIEITVGDLAYGVVSPISVWFTVQDLGTGGPAETSPGDTTWIVAEGVNHPAIVTDTNPLTGTIYEQDEYVFSASVTDPDSPDLSNPGPGIGNKIDLYHWVITNEGSYTANAFVNGIDWVACRDEMELSLSPYTLNKECLPEDGTNPNCANYNQMPDTCIVTEGCKYLEWGELAEIEMNSGESQTFAVVMPDMPPSDTEVSNCTYSYRFYAMDSGLLPDDCPSGTECVTGQSFTVNEYGTPSLDTDYTPTLNGNSAGAIYPSKCYEDGDAGSGYDPIFIEATANSNNGDNPILGISFDFIEANNHVAADFTLDPYDADYGTQEVQQLAGGCPNSPTMYTDDFGASYTCGAFNIDVTASTEFEADVSVSDSIAARCLPVVHMPSTLSFAEETSVDLVVKVHLGNSHDTCSGIQAGFNFNSELISVAPSGWSHSGEICTKTLVVQGLSNVSDVSGTVELTNFKYTVASWNNFEHTADAGVSNMTTTYNITDVAENPYFDSAFRFIGYQNGSLETTDYTWGAEDVNVDEDPVNFDPTKDYFEIQLKAKHPLPWPETDEVTFTITQTDGDFQIYNDAGSLASFPMTLTATNAVWNPTGGEFTVSAKIVPNENFNTQMHGPNDGEKSVFGLEVTSPFGGSSTEQAGQENLTIELTVNSVNDPPVIGLSVSSDPIVILGGGGAVSPGG